jgi:hypothetical protein
MRAVDWLDALTSRTDAMALEVLEQEALTTAYALLPESARRMYCRLIIASVELLADRGGDQ